MRCKREPLPFVQLKYFPLEVGESFEIVCEGIILTHFCGVGHFEDHFCEPLQESVAVVCDKFLHMLVREMGAQF